MLSKCHPAFILICIWKGDENTPKRTLPKKSTKWNNILIRLEHAHRSLTTRTPLKLPLTATSLHQSLYQHQECAQPFSKRKWKTTGWIIVGQIVGTQFGQIKNVQWRCLAELESESPLSNHSFSCKNVKKSISKHNGLIIIFAQFDTLKLWNVYGQLYLNITRHTFDMFFRFFGVYTLVIHYSLNIFTLL